MTENEDTPRVLVTYASGGATPELAAWLAACADVLNRYGAAPAVIEATALASIYGSAVIALVDGKLVAKLPTPG